MLALAKLSCMGQPPLTSARRHPRVLEWQQVFHQRRGPLSPVSWMIAAFAVFMACVCLFAYIQIERNAHQARQRRMSQEPRHASIAKR